MDTNNSAKPELSYKTLAGIVFGTGCLWVVLHFLPAMPTPEPIPILFGLLMATGGAIQFYADGEPSSCETYGWVGMLILTAAILVTRLTGALHECTLRL